MNTVRRGSYKEKDPSPSSREEDKSANKIGQYMKASLYIYTAVDRIQIYLYIASWFAFIKADMVQSKLENSPVFCDLEERW